MAIVHPMLNRRFSATRVVHGVMIGGAWLLSAIYSLPWLVAYDIVTIDSDTVYCYNTLPLNTRVYAMVNFFVLYVTPLVFLTFVYVRISVILWRSSTILSLPLTSLHLFHSEHHHHQHQCRESGAQQPQYPRQAASRGTSSARLYLNTSCPNSPYLSANSPKQTSNCNRLSLRRSVYERVTPAAAAEHRQMSDNELVLPATTTTTSRRSTTTYTMAARERRSTQLNFLTSRRKVVRLLAVIVISFALCMLPHHVRVQCQEWKISTSYSHVDIYIPPLTTLAFYVNSCLNPLLYALISDKFRQAFSNLRCCQHAQTAPPLMHPLEPVQAAAHRPVVRCNSQPIDSNNIP